MKNFNEKHEVIQPQELRIGNYYQGASRGNIETVTWQTLRDLSEGKLNLLPIPLTEEILLKFGFEKEERGYLSIGKLRGAITVCKAERESDRLCYRWFINNLKMTDLHFVHQLQNLYFFLTGEELTLNK